MMKALALLAAVGLATVGLTGAAQAQDVRHTTVRERPNGTVVRRTTVRPAYGAGAYHRGYYGHPGWNRWHHPRHCTTHWAYGHRVTRCW